MLQKKGAAHGFSVLLEFGSGGRLLHRLAPVQTPFGFDLQLLLWPVQTPLDLQRSSLILPRGVYEFCDLEEELVAGAISDVSERPNSPCLLPGFIGVIGIGPDIQLQKPIKVRGIVLEPTVMHPAPDSDNVSCAYNRSSLPERLQEG
jgi:hypothetical protein